MYCLTSTDVSQNRSHDSLIQPPCTQRLHASSTRDQRHRDRHSLPRDRDLLQRQLSRRSRAHLVLLLQACLRCLTRTHHSLPVPHAFLCGPLSMSRPSAPWCRLREMQVPNTVGGAANTGGQGDTSAKRETHAARIADQEIRHTVRRHVVLCCGFRFAAR